MEANQKRINKGLYWDRAWSLVEGCSYVSEGCKNCWSASQASMRSKQSNPKIRERYSGVTDENGRWNGNIKFLHDNLILPSKVKRPQIWSVWNDLLHEKVMLIDILKTVKVIQENPQHIFLVLTKRPHRISDFMKFEGNPQFEFPDNMWIGVTAENQQTADERIPLLLQIPAKVRFVSVEPMLSPINFWRWFPIGSCPKPHPEIAKLYPQFNPDYENGINWIICGAETGHNRRDSDIDWFRSLRDQCKSAGVPYFHKKHYEDGKSTRILDGMTHDEFPEYSDYLKPY